MGTPLHKAQVVLRTCSDHQHQEHSYYCKTCKKFVCTTCVKTDHKNHDWDLVPSVAKECRRETPKRCRKIKDKLPYYKDALDKNENSANKESKKKYLEALEERRAVIIEAVNKLIEEKKQAVDNITDNGSTAFGGKRKTVGKIVEYVEKMANSLDQNIEAYSDYDVIEMEQDLLKGVEKLEKFCAQTDEPVSFSAGHIDPMTIEKMVGDVQYIKKVGTNEDTNVTVENITTLKVFNSDYTSLMTTITPVTDTDAWIGNSQKSSIKLYSTSNKEIRRKRLEGSGTFAMLSNGDHIVCCYRTLIRVSSDGTVMQLTFSTPSPLVPSSAFRTQSDDILVGLQNDAFLYQLQPSSRRLVQRLTITGETLHARETYEFHGDGTSRLFIHPNIAMENTNSDVCVNDLTGPTTGNLIVLRKDGQVRFIYNKNRPGTKTFYPSGLACDSESRIIVGDFFSKSLHLLTSEGQLLKYIATDSPNAIALRGNILWVGLNHGKVSVYRYKTNL